MPTCCAHCLPACARWSKWRRARSGARNVGRAWTAEEESTLVAAFKSGDFLADIAARHGRTVRAIEARLERLGLLTPDQRSTHDSFVQPAPAGAPRPRPP